MGLWVKDIAVLPIVKKHLSGKIDPDGGIVIGKRPPKIRLDIVTLGVLTAVKLSDSVKGVININHYHEDTVKIGQLSAQIIDIMDLAYLNYYLFEYDRHTNFRLSHTLWMGNIRVGFTIDNLYFNKLLS